MSYDEIERSNYDAVPTSLYEFNIGTTFWRYSSDAEPTIFGGNTYLPMPISDSGVKQSGDAQQDDMRVTLPSSAPFAALFRGTPPAEQAWLTIRRIQRGEPDAPILWVGTVSSAKQTRLVTTELVCLMLTASFDRNGLRLSWGRGCPHALYDRNCRADKSAFAVSMQVDSMSGVAIEAAPLATYPNGWFAGGFFEFITSAGLTDRRPIERHVGSRIAVLGTTDGMAVDMWFTAYPGCDRTTATCLDKFNNLLNYGGFPHMPGKSPFDGTPIY